MLTPRTGTMCDVIGGIGSSFVMMLRQFLRKAHWRTSRQWHPRIGEWYFRIGFRRNRYASLVCGSAGASRFRKGSSQARFRISVTAVVFSLLFVSPVFASDDDEVLRAFLDHVQYSKSIPAKTKEIVSKEARDRGDESASDFLIEAMALLSPPFLQGLDAYDAEDYPKVISEMKKAAGGDDPFVAANARAFVVKSLAEQDKLEEALEQVTPLVADENALDLHTYFAAEMLYIKGYAELQTLHYSEAGRTLRTMIERYPEAASRLRVTARQMLAELGRREPDKIGDVTDLMVYAARRLGNSDTGDRVQDQQQRAIDLLDALIEEAEDNEQSSSSGGGSGSGKGQSQPQSPMQDSQLPGGSAQEGYLRTTRQAKPGEAWGAMPASERKRILQSLRDSFTSRYRSLVEQYYQELSKEP